MILQVTTVWGLDGMVCQIQTLECISTVECCWVQDFWVPKITSTLDWARPWPMCIWHVANLNHKRIILSWTRQHPCGSVFCGFNTPVTLVQVKLLLQEVASMVYIGNRQDHQSLVTFSMTWFTLFIQLFIGNSLAVHNFYCQKLTKYHGYQKVITCVWYSYTKYICSLCTECC